MGLLKMLNKNVIIRICFQLIAKCFGVCLSLRVFVLFSTWCINTSLINSLFIFILLQIFSNFPHYGLLDTPII